MAWHVEEIFLTRASGLVDVLTLMQNYANREQRTFAEFRAVVQSLLAQPSRVWVLYDDDHYPWGYLWAVKRSDTEYQVHHLYAPRYGKMLFNEVKEILRGEGVTKLSCFVDTKARLRLFSRPPYNGRIAGYYVECEV